jgi:hypothetical protein
VKVGCRCEFKEVEYTLVEFKTRVITLHLCDYKLWERALWVRSILHFIHFTNEIFEYSLELILQTLTGHFFEFSNYYGEVEYSDHCSFCVVCSAACIEAFGIVGISYFGLGSQNIHRVRSTSIFWCSLSIHSVIFMLFGLLHSYQALGLKNAFTLFSITYIVCFGAEFLGLNYGFLFGQYRPIIDLGPTIFGGMNW